MHTAQNDVVTTQHTHVKHSKYLTVLATCAQNAANAVLYTSAQQQQAQQLAQAVQAVYFSKRVYTNLRANFIAIKICNAVMCNSLQIIAATFNATIVQTQNAIILHIA